ncbi:MAG: hypothetical protein ACK5S0_00355 [bacterium]|jgi:hypothetical protein
MTRLRTDKTLGKPTSRQPGHPNGTNLMLSCVSISQEAATS